MNCETRQLNEALDNARSRLIEEMDQSGCWTGHLSSSALATAVASFALHLGGREATAERGLQWLRNHRNPDGGWGDSPESPSNFTTTLLCRCALGEEDRSPDHIVQSILDFYGKDRTFSVPIVTMCMLSGKLGNDWRIVPQLPFELACFPHRFYRFLRLPVVSYALPALIAIGLVRHANRPSRWAFYRNRLVAGVLRILQEIQPESGGFLEAAPLSGFVAMSLIGAGFRDHAVTRGCLRFLEETVRDDGSWPIDVSLSTWLTSLSVRALHETLSEPHLAAVRSHLLDTQWTEEHPFTHAAPGGWGWTSTQGAVPDADDTAAALIALHVLGGEPTVAERGIQWLLQLQNRDGGMPTFCRGWGKLPFDRSCSDLTAHMIRAFWTWRDEVTPELRKTMFRAMRRGLDFLAREQRHDGSWVPLWFGSQSHPEHENPVYGTVRVLEGIDLLDENCFPAVSAMRQRGHAWLEEARNADGSWGHSVEETALAVGITGKGVDYLLDITANGTSFSASPIGLYFASLWYSEKLYPMIFTVEALQRCKTRLEMTNE